MPRAPRFPVILPLRYRAHGDSGWSYGMTVDISRSGVLFRADHALDVHAPLEIEVVLPGDFEASARVVSRGVVKRTSAPADALNEELIAASIDVYHLVRVPREAIHQSSTDRSVD